MANEIDANQLAKEIAKEIVTRHYQDSIDVFDYLWETKDKLPLKNKGGLDPWFWADLTNNIFPFILDVASAVVAEFVIGKVLTKKEKNEKIISIVIKNKTKHKVPNKVNEDVKDIVPKIIQKHMNQTIKKQATNKRKITK